MSFKTKIALVLGAGKNIGYGVAQKFSNAGYKVAVVSRNAAHNTTTPEGYLSLKADLGKPESVPQIFESVKKAFGGPPSAVIYNAASLSPPSDPENPFSVPLDAIDRDLALMNTSAYVAAREAVAGFSELDASLPKGFIYTGNRLAGNVMPAPIMMTLGLGKSAASYFIGSASEFYKSKGYKFFFADERTIDGGSMTLAQLSGEEAGNFYLDLVEKDEAVPWFATFVAGKGYTYFANSSRT